MKKRFFCSSLLLVSGMFFFTGCRNYLDTVENTSLDYKRSSPQIDYILKGYAYGLDPSTLSIELQETRKSTVVTYSVHNTMVRYTPYSFWRELYEFPMGICLLPVSIGGHILNVFSFGLFPYRMAAAVTNTSFAGMNPFINVESESRVCEELEKSIRKEIDRKEETQSGPAVNVPVAIGNASFKISGQTNSGGRADIHLLELDGRGPTINGNRGLGIYLAGIKTSNEEVIVDRSKQADLFKASQLLSAYHRAPTGKKLAEAVWGLEELKYSSLAFKLEKQELAKYTSNSAFINEFNTHIAKLSKK